MATNVKKTKKKASKTTYNSKLPLYVAIGLAVLVTVLVAGYLIWYFSTNYVAKVDGKKILNYEYEYYAQIAAEEVSEEINESLDLPEDATDADKNAAIQAALESDETKKKITDLALEKSVEYETGYLLAQKEGFKLTKDEKNNVDTNIDYMINYYYSMYTYSGYQVTYDDIVGMVCGNLSLSQYKKLAKKQAVAEKYRTSLKDDISIADADVKEAYDEDPDAYRTIDARVMYIKYPDAPAKMTSEEPVKENFTDDAKYEEALETYKTSKEEYDKKVEEYDAKVKTIDERAQAIANALNTEGKYSELKLDENGEAEKDANGNDVYLYKDADFKSIIKAASDLASSEEEDPGFRQISADSKLNVAEVDDFIFSYQWTADRTGIGSVASEKTDDDASENAIEETKLKAPTVAAEGKLPTDISVVKAEKGVYLVRCEGITDYDSEAEEGETENAIRAGIRDSIIDEKATEKLDAIIAEKTKDGADYSAKKISEKRMKKIIDEIYG